MLKHRLERQGAVSVHSSTDSASMPSPPPVRRRRNSQDAKLYRQLSTESLDNLISSPAAHHQSFEDRRQSRARRHSVACGVLYTDIQKPSLKSALNCAARRMSDVCSLLSSAPSSTYNLSSSNCCSRKKENEVILPQVLGTFRQSMKPPVKDSKGGGSKFLVNRRFSTDCPPPTYNEATTKAASRQKLLMRQHEVVSSKNSLMALEDDCGSQEE